MGEITQNFYSHALTYSYSLPLTKHTHTIVYRNVTLQLDTIPFEEQEGVAEEIRSAEAVIVQPEDKTRHDYLVKSLFFLSRLTCYLGMLAATSEILVYCYDGCGEDSLCLLNTPFPPIFVSWFYPLYLALNYPLKGVDILLLESISITSIIAAFTYTNWQEEIPPTVISQGWFVFVALTLCKFVTLHIASKRSMTSFVYRELLTNSIAKNVIEEQQRLLRSKRYWSFVV